MGLILVCKIKIGRVPLEREPLSHSFFIISANNYKKSSQIKLEKDVSLSGLNVTSDKKIIE